jgi:hypothetical protein
MFYLARVRGSGQAEGMNQRSEQAWAKWRKLVPEQGQSGQTVAAFCRERGLPTSHFFYWKKRLQEAAAPPFVEVAQAKVEPAPTRATIGTTIEIRLDNGRSVVVGPDFDADHLRALLAVVES